jgi:hypothetical protein
MKLASKFLHFPYDIFHFQDTEVLVHGMRDKHASMKYLAEAQNAPTYTY